MLAVEALDVEGPAIAVPFPGKAVQLAVLLEFLIVITLQVLHLRVRTDVVVHRLEVRVLDLGDLPAQNLKFDCGPVKVYRKAAVMVLVLESNGNCGHDRDNAASPEKCIPTYRSLLPAFCRSR